MTPAHRGATLSGLFPELRPWTAAALWHGLADSSCPQSSLDDEIDSILEHRLGPLLLAAATAHSWPISKENVTALRIDAFRRLQHSVLVVNRGVAAVQALNDAGIPCAVSKGPGMAAAYGSPELRPFADIDVLVGPRDFRRAMQRLRDLGYVERTASRQPWRSFDRYCREGVNVLSDDGGSVDLHHHVPPWFWGRGINSVRLLNATLPVTMLGGQLPCVTPATNLLIGALHVVSDKNSPGSTLLIWRDVAQLATITDPVEVAQLAQLVGLDAWLGDVLEALPADLRPARLLELLAVRPGRRIRGALRLKLLLAVSSQGGRVVVTQVLRLPASHALVYLMGMFFPTRRFLREREALHQPSYFAWWRSSLTRSRDRTLLGQAALDGDAQ